MGIYFSLKTPVRPVSERTFQGLHGTRARAGLASHSKIPPKILTDYPSMAPTWALPKFQVLGLRLLGAFRAAATHTGSMHANHKNATVWGGWACEVPLRPHEVAQTCTHGASEPSAGGAGGHVLHRAYDI